MSDEYGSGDLSEPLRCIRISFVFGCSLYTDPKLYIQGEQIKSMNRKRAVKIPYEGYTLPPSSEKGGQFVDFKRIIERKPVKKVRIKK